MSADQGHSSHDELTLEQRHARRVFEVNLKSATALAKLGVPIPSICAGLLAVCTELASQVMPGREVRRMLLQAADSHGQAHREFPLPDGQALPGASEPGRG